MNKHVTTKKVTSFFASISCICIIITFSPQHIQALRNGGTSISLEE